LLTGVYGTGSQPAAAARSDRTPCWALPWTNARPANGSVSGGGSKMRRL